MPALEFSRWKPGPELCAEVGVTEWTDGGRYCGWGKEFAELAD